MAIRTSRLAACPGLLGVQRTSVQRVLKQLGDAGLVEMGYRRIDLLDRAGLMTLIGDDEET